MDSPSLNCLRCQREMDLGFVADHRYVTVRVSSWVAGAPKKSFVTGSAIVKDEIPIRTYRCPSCGYLESYAREEWQDATS